MPVEKKSITSSERKNRLKTYSTKSPASAP